MLTNSAFELCFQIPNDRNLLNRSFWRKGKEVDTYAGAVIMLKPLNVISI